MDTAKIIINADEFIILSDKEFFYHKKKITERISSLFAQVRDALAEEIRTWTIILPEGTDISTGKLSKGENYKNLPYQILDFPKKLSNESSFSFRTMFWWGNFFSCHFYVGGNFFDIQCGNIEQNLKSLSGKGFYINLHETPWEYAFDDAKFVPVEAFIEQKIDLKKLGYFKVSRKLPLKEYLNAPAFAAETLNACKSLLS